MEIYATLPRLLCRVFMIVISLACGVTPAIAQDGDYQLGHGFRLSNSLTVGGYFSIEYANGDTEKDLKVDDLAVLAYGAVTNNLSYMVELESVDFYRADFLSDSESTQFPPSVERLYADYKISDSLAIRAGKQITPIGYWNLQPINVLRETSSSPLFSSETFPKFLSGLDIYGYTAFDDSLTYHLYLQTTRDIDDEYINIKTDRHFGLSLEKQFESNFQMGGSIGSYTEINNTKTGYLQLNAKFNSASYTVQAEGIVNERDIPGSADQRSETLYVQGEYRLAPRHALIARAEYFNDDIRVSPERIGILGYSYRPVFPVSIKIEYQVHSNSRDNKILTSFAVLF